MIPGSVTPLLLKSATAAGGLQIERSLRFNSSDSAYLSRTPSSAGNRKTWTWSGWVKRAALSGSRQAIFICADAGATVYTGLEFDASERINFYDSATSGTVARLTTAVFRDVSSWYHILLSVDTTAATADNRVRLFVNGSEITVFTTKANPTQNADTYINAAVAHSIGSWSPAAGLYFSGYLADIHFIDGQALTPSSFTEVSATTGQLIPKAYTGSFGTNGFWLKFSDNSAATATTLGKDYSGNSNNWTPNNLSVTAGAGNDSLVDTPTSYGTDTGAGGEVRGNYCTANPLATTTSLTLSNGNLQVVGGLVGGATYRGNSTIGVASGKWYFETTFVSVGDNTAVGIGQSNIIDQYPGQDALSYAYVFEPAVRINSNSQVSYGSALTAGDVFMCAFDLDNNKIFFGKNGTWFGSSVPASGTNPAYTLSAGTYTPIFRPQKNSGTCEIQFNFGQRPFAYTAPSGFKALCDTNLTAPVVAKPSDYFQTVLYTGNGSSQSITNLGFSPDFLWFKNRSGANSHALFDSVRGRAFGLSTDSTGAESTSSAGNDLSSFDSTGFTVGTPQNFNSPNINGGSIVAWAWDAGSSTVTNTQGSITSQVRANASAGFSIVTYTGNGVDGATVGHGLGVAPQFIILKARGNTYNWGAWHTSIGKYDANHSYALALNLTRAADATSQYPVFYPGLNSSTVFGLGNEATSNQSSATYVAYCFSPVTGYSNFGSYTGTSAAQFIYLGFRPKFWMHKLSSSTGSWMMLDSSRDPYNVAGQQVYANLSNAESTYSGGVLDFVSNGVVLRSTGNDVNGSGNTYIYMCFAESPFNYSRAR